MTTGISQLDTNFTMQQGELVVIGAKSSHGTTSFIIDITLHNNKNNKNTVIYSYENSQQELLAMVSKKSDDELNIIQSHFTITQLIDDIRIQHKTNKIDMVIIDSIQLIKNNSTFPTTYSDARDLKNLAMELDIVVLVVSKIAEPYKNKLNLVRPILHDLDKNSEFTQFASKVLIIYRKSIDNKILDQINQDEAIKNNKKYKSTYVNNLIDDTELIIVKNKTHLQIPQIIKINFDKLNIKFINKGAVYIDPKAKTLDSLDDLEPPKL